jgi:hypothetical protein
MLVLVWTLYVHVLQGFGPGATVSTHTDFNMFANVRKYRIL